MSQVRRQADAALKAQEDLDRALDDTIVSPDVMAETRRLLSREAAAALVRFVSADHAPPEQKAKRLTEVMAGLRLSASDFQSAAGESTSEQHLFQAAERVASTGRLDLPALRAELKGGGYAFFEGDPVRFANAVRRERASDIGGRLDDRYPAEFLESRLGAYSRLMVAHYIQSSSRIGAFPRPARRWANEIATTERRLNDALNARQAKADTLGDRNDRLPAGAITAVGVASAAVTAGSSGLGLENVTAGSLVVLLASLAVGAFTAFARAPLFARVVEERARRRTAHAELNRQLRAGPAASPGR